ncbi:MAG TPA: glycerol-3-phosphate dehydrogenase [Burkholderiaceae bacterium]|nr:glycerol-3-phosphate dehydrogenase [Burkholderiaceae bacterium]
MMAQGAASPTIESGEILDLLIVGGGINGAGIARDAAGRGLTVALVEKGDLAQGTSSRSSRLIHGGLRYLEYGEFRLVREALHEREILLSAAPHLVRPIKFVLPHVAGMRPAWMLRAGLYFYDHLARRRRLAASAPIALDRAPEGEPLRPEIRRGFTYADCRTDDVRLVVHNAVAAAALGAKILTGCELVHAGAHDGLWKAELRDARKGAVRSLQARVLINAAGPWVEDVAPRIAGVRRAHHARLVKGSHVVVRKFWSGDHGYLLQNVDRRVVFVTPYEDDWALIGTTDIAFSSSPDAVAISPGEVRYLLDAVNRQLRRALASEDIVYAFSGVRCLVDDEKSDPSAVTRDYRIEAATSAQHPPAITVLGGKITTYRRLAEHVLELLKPHFPRMRAAWTAQARLPGGDFPDPDFNAAQRRFVEESAFLPPAHARGLLARHGTVAYRMLAGVRTREAMGQHFGAGLYERELRHLVEHEWARTSDDVLWRRTKFGLRLSAEQIRALDQWMAAATLA